MKKSATKSKKAAAAKSKPILEDFHSSLREHKTIVLQNYKIVTSSTSQESTGVSSWIGAVKQRLKISDACLTVKKSDSLVSLKEFDSNSFSLSYEVESELLKTESVSSTLNVSSSAGSTAKPASASSSNRCDQADTRSLSSWDHVRSRDFDRGIFKRYGTCRISSLFFFDIFSF
jgi:hypothetical protein